MADITITITIYGVYKPTFTSLGGTILYGSWGFSPVSHGFGSSFVRPGQAPEDGTTLPTGWTKHWSSSKQLEMHGGCAVKIPKKNRFEHDEMVI